MGKPPPIDEIFHQALQFADAASREEYLRKACGDDRELRGEVDGLLAAVPQMSDFLNPRPMGTENDASLPSNDDNLVGQEIGPYKLLQLLGEGGMGVVYLAEQEQPVRRRVALKVIRSGLNSTRIVARFEQERLALGLMDHPNIARVLDAGTTLSGLPFFAMELAEGIPITRYCDQERLSLLQRLKLFVPVCRAVQHAHQKGIVHRDLKPSNVIVAVYDGQPVPKIIDFGVAKAIGNPLIERVATTEHGQIIGTMEYMAPEQTESSSLDVDTRADIYSLGVLLYELLTGSPPFTAKELREAGLGEMLRIIKEVEPSKPSTKITSAEDLPRVAANRQIEPWRLARQVAGELDWITMKCLEKDRNRRYATAYGLARDLERFLADEPVQAVPPTVGYRLIKFARRHRIPVIAAGLILLSLLAGIIGTTWGLVDARAARIRESQSRAREKERADAETAERKRAEAAEAESEAIINFLRSDLIGQAGSPAQARRNFTPNPNLTIREALDRAAAAVGEQFDDRPELEAAIRKTIGESYSQLGLFDKAIEQLQKAMEIDERQRGPDHSITLDAKDSLAQAFRGATRYADAIQLLEENVASRSQSLGSDALATWITRDVLAITYRDAGRNTEALELLEQVRDAEIRLVGEEHPTTLVTLHNLASMYLVAGKINEAIPALEQVLASKTELFGREHPETLPALQNLAAAYWKAKQLDKSVPRFEELVAIYAKVYGEGHPLTIAANANLGVNYRDAGRSTEAIALLQQAYDAGRGQPGLGWIGPELLIAFERAERFDDAAALAKQMLAESRKTVPPDGLELASLLAKAGTSLLRVKAWADAESALRECLTIRQREQPAEWRTHNTKALLGEALLGQARYAEAEPLLLEGRAGILELQDKAPKGLENRVAETARKLAELYRGWEKPDEAAKWQALLESGN